MTTLPNVAQLPLTLLLFYGSFSRFTHGTYTPGFHAYQIARQPDDGSSTAVSVPVIDFTLGLTILLAPRRWKRRVALFAGLAQAAAIVKLVGVDGWSLGEVVGDLTVVTVCALAWTGS